MATTSGAGADTPVEIPGRGWLAIAKRVFNAVLADHISLIAAGIAFYGLLALFPALTACMAIAGLLTEPQGVVDTLEQVGQLMPEQAADIIIDQAVSVSGSSSGGLGLAALIALAIAIFSASRGTASLIEGLNVAYKQRDSRGIIKSILLQYALTFALLLGFVIGIAITVILPVMIAWFGSGSIFEIITRVASWAILAAMALTGLGVLYSVGPDRQPPNWRWLTPGAVIATILWVGASIGFGFYVSNFASYNETFGTLGGVIVLLMWLWLSTFIVLLGAEINSETERQARGKTAPPTQDDSPHRICEVHG